MPRMGPRLDTRVVALLYAGQNTGLSDYMNTKLHTFLQIVERLQKYMPKYSDEDLS